MIGLILLSMALQEAPPVPENPPILVEGSKAPEEKKVCRTVRETGSRRVKQVCRTAAQQRQDDLEAKNKLGMGNRTTSPTETFKAPTGQ
jgi:hypothetical protein